MVCSLKQCCIGCYISGSDLDGVLIEAVLYWLLHQWGGLDVVLIEAVLYWLLHQWEWPGCCAH